MTESVEKTNGATSRIQSVERAFSIIEEAALHREGISLSDLSRTLGLHTSTLYHLTKTLTALGYLRTGPGKKYTVGRGIFHLASTCMDEIELANAFQPYLEKLAESTGESTHFAVWEKREVLILGRASGTSSLQLTERAGTLRPVHCTAIGKTLLAGLSEEERDARIAALTYTVHTPNTLKGPQELTAQVIKAEAEGVAFDDCEYNEDVRCMAAPVRDFTGNVIGAIGFSGPVWRMSFSDMAKYIPVAQELAQELSSRLGFTAGPDLPTTPLSTAPLNGAPNKEHNT